MIGIATLLLLCAVFAALAAFAVTAALRSARVDNLIGEVFSPWLHGPFGTAGEAEPAKLTSRDDSARERPLHFNADLSEPSANAATPHARG